MKTLAPIKSLAARAQELHRKASEGSTNWIIALSKPDIVADALEFQDPIDQICAEEPPRLMRSVLYVGLALAVTTVLVCAIVKVEIVVVGTGRLATAVPPIVIQPMDRAIIRELKVRQGDIVKKGQVLATMDPTFAQADFTSLSTQKRSLDAQVHRLEAEVDGRPFVIGDSPTSEELLQSTLFNQRRAQYESQLRMYDQEIERRRSNIRASEDEITSGGKQLSVAKELEKMRGANLEKQFGSKLNFLEAQSNRMRMEQMLQGSENRLSEQKHDLQSKQAERQTFVDQWRHQTVDSLVTARTEAAKTEESMSKASLLNDLVVLTAPEDAVVLDIAKKSVGSILNGAEPLVTLSQSNAPLVAEISIGSADIGYTKGNAEVVVKVDAFPYQKHGLLHGRLLSVSEESFAAASPEGQQSILSGPSRSGGGAFHRGLVEIGEFKLANLPQGARLIPGMTLTAEIQVGSRSVLSFFLYPITRGLSESIREP
jgi:hemolysin D